MSKLVEMMDMPCLGNFSDLLEWVGCFKIINT